MSTTAQVLALLDRIRLAPDAAARLALADSLAAPTRPTILSFLNAHAVNLCFASRETLAAFRASDVLLRDGVGMKMAMACLGRAPGVNMNGTDFLPILLDRLPRRRLALYGTENPWLDTAAARIERSTRHTIVDVRHGFHHPDVYLEAAASVRPDVILLAMGMPRQERVAAALKRTLDHPALILNGGAILDFLACRFQRAPGPVQRAGLEWAFRLAQEPRRLFGRYCVGGVVFARNLLALRRAALAERRSAATA